MDCVNSSVVVAMVILNISEVLQGEVTPIRPVENVRKKGEGKKKKQHQSLKHVKLFSMFAICWRSFIRPALSSDRLQLL